MDLHRKLADFAATGIDQIILLNQAGNNTHEDIMSSLELFATEVMPEFQAMEGAHQKWKADVLAGRIQLEVLDTAGHTTAMRALDRAGTGVPAAAADGGLPAP